MTSEPKGGRKARTSKLPFVIQKHAASHLHYDFRLGWNGVLKSWAVAKGPSYVTKDKRLAVQVEDHPIEYGGFEGVIPKGQYGGGSVLLWDQGTWEPQPGNENVDAGLKEGSLKFILHGTKLKGKWALIRMRGGKVSAGKTNWLLIKEHDEFERDERAPSITDEVPTSVVTGRNLNEIARDGDHIRSSDHSKSALASTARPAEVATRKDLKVRKKTGKQKAEFDLDSYPKEKLPKFVPPQLAMQSESATDDPDWLHEIKLDGYRIQTIKNGESIRLITRSGIDWTHRMKEIAADLVALPANQAVLDGEVVALEENGVSNFAKLQISMQENEKHPLNYFLFDLLHLNGHNLRQAPLLERKELLARLVSPENNRVRFSEYIDGNGIATFDGACKLGAEGIISKRASSKYSSGRSGNWLKIKCGHEQELVIGGFTLPSNGIHGIGALLLGYYDEQDNLVYAGRTGTGFSQAVHRMLRNRLDELKTKANPFKNVPTPAQRGVRWVRPVLVAQIKFATWTTDLRVRQAAFKGLRDDKPASEVRREVPVKPPPEPRNSIIHKSASAKHTVRLKTAMSVPKSRQEQSNARPSIRLTHPDKILDEESGLTKLQLSDYYSAIAEFMLPEIANRPLSLVRCPEGSGKPCFFQKHTTSSLPSNVETVEIPDKKTGKLEPYITLSTEEALAGLAQMGVLEIHPWGCHNNDLERPDRIIFDLDPDSSIGWKVLSSSALEVRRLLKSLGLKSYAKSTGEKEFMWLSLSIQNTNGRRSKTSHIRLLRFLKDRTPLSTLRK